MDASHPDFFFNCPQEPDFLVVMSAGHSNTADLTERDVQGEQLNKGKHACRYAGLKYY